MAKNVCKRSPNQQRNKDFRCAFIHVILYFSTFFILNYKCCIVSYTNVLFGVGVRNKQGKCSAKSIVFSHHHGTAASSVFARCVIGDRHQQYRKRIKPVLRDDNTEIIIFKCGQNERFFFSSSSACTFVRQYIISAFFVVVLGIFIAHDARRLYLLF